MEQSLAKKWDNGELEAVPKPEVIKNLKATLTVNQAVIEPNPNDSEDIAIYRSRLATYRMYALDTGIPISNIGGCAALGIAVSTYKNWLKGIAGAEKKQFAEEFRNIFSMYREQLAHAGLISPPVAIFWAKNFDGLKDEPDEENEAPDLLGDMIEPSAIREKYENLPED